MINVSSCSDAAYITRFLFTFSIIRQIGEIGETDLDYRNRVRYSQIDLVSDKQPFKLKFALT